MPRVLLLLLSVALIVWLAASFIARHPAATPEAPPVAGPTASSPAPGPVAGTPLPGERLMLGYADPGTAPIEDLRKLQHVLGGYFSVIKDLTQQPIGGNRDLAACLLGENPNRQAFLPPDHPAFGDGGQVVDRWGTPLFVHPEAAREITLRSAGPDRELFTDDDLVLLPNGVAPRE